MTVSRDERSYADNLVIGKTSSSKGKSVIRSKGVEVYGLRRLIFCQSVSSAKAKTKDIFFITTFQKCCEASLFLVSLKRQGAFF